MDKWYIYDIEILKNVFTVVFKNENEQQVFTLHESRNQFKELVLFLQKLQREDYSLIGFNNFNFDYHFLDWILCNYKSYIKTYKSKINEIIDSLYKLSYNLINEDLYLKHKTNIKQIDLYLIHHFNNPARRCSLKWLEFAMNMELVEDTPFNFYDEVTIEEVDSIVIPYNINDVEATYMFYKISLPEIKHREIFGGMYNMYLQTDSHTNISKKIFAKALMEEMNVDWWELKSLRTVRDRIHLKDIIFDNIEFKTQMFKYLLDKLKKTTISKTNEINEVVEYAGLHFNIGSGGIHAYPKKWEYTKQGIRKKDPVNVAQKFESSNTHKLILVDVSSYYPNLGIKNNLKPAHLGLAFTKVYSNMYDQRFEAKHANPKTDFTKAKDLGLKLGLNSVFGLSNEENSFFFDLEYLLSITINGQLLLMMLAESIHEAGIKLVQCNTDGIYVYIKNEDIDKLKDICNDWQKLTGLSLDFDYFSKLFQLNINNYLAVTDTGYVKEKGASFVVNTEWHKDHSAKVVRKAIRECLLNDIPYRDYIYNHDNLDDFLLAVRLHKGDCIEERYIENGEYKVNTYTGVVRYAITKARHLEKVYKSGNSSAVNKDWKATVCNRKSDVSLTDIDRVFYIKEAEKIISQFQTNQLSLL
jgi:hypothetical protein